MKRIFLICSLLISLIGFGQSEVNRSSGANTVVDDRWKARHNLGLPVYADTTIANLTNPNNIGIDSCGAKIYTRNPQAEWTRYCSPKRWVKTLDLSNLGDNFFWDSTCNCFKIDTSALINIINNYNIDSSITSISIVDDSTVRICYSSGSCVNVGFNTNITNINTVYFVGRDSIAVCTVDTTGGVVTKVCDTVPLGVNHPTTLYQNAIKQIGNIIELGGDAQNDTQGWLYRNTWINTRYSQLSIVGNPIYDATLAIKQLQEFGVGTPSLSLQSAGASTLLSSPPLDTNNVVKLYFNYTSSKYNNSVSGYMGDKIGYMLNTNSRGYGSYGMLNDNQKSKYSGILFHTLDTLNNDAITFFAGRPPLSQYIAAISNGENLLNNRIATFNTDKTIVFHGYDSTNTSVGNLLNDKVLSTDSTGKVILSKVVGARNVMPERTTILYSMPNSNLTNSYDDYTVGGAMATATITQVGGYDNIIVGGTDQNSYFYPTNRIFTGTPIYGHLRVKAISLGGTAPILGFRILSAPSPYVNFTNQQGYIYVNLSSGTMTSSFSGYATTTTQNSFSATVAANEIVDVYFKWEYNNTMEMKIVKNNLNGDMSQIVKTWVAQSSNSASICRLAAIMADGTYQLLSYEIGVKSFERPKVLLAGDSEMSGACISFSSTIYSQLKGSIPYNIAQFSAPASYLAGMQAVQRDIIQLNPEVVFFDNILDALYNNDCDPSDPQFATWSANFNKYVNNLIEAGVEPILFVPSCTPLYPDSRVTTMINYWTTNFPGRQYVERTSTEGGFDCTGFHLNADANAIIVTKLITALNTLNKL